MSPTMVIGIYEDNGQVFVTTVPNPDPQEAIRRVAQEAVLESTGHLLVILGAVTNGDDDTLVFTEPEDNVLGNGVFAQDLVGGSDDVAE